MDRSLSAMFSAVMVFFVDYLEWFSTPLFSVAELTIVTDAQR